jgi:hypothetical protein
MYSGRRPLCTISQMATGRACGYTLHYRGPYEFGVAELAPATGSGVYSNVAIPFIKHTPVGKSTQAQPHTAAAHIRYISRKRNTNHIESDGMPVHYWAAQDFLNNREDSIRKNGRVCDKFIIALPNEMTVEQGVATVRKFGDKLCRWDESQQRFLRGSYYFTLQDHGISPRLAPSPFNSRQTTILLSKFLALSRKCCPASDSLACSGAVSATIAFTQRVN